MGVRTLDEIVAWQLADQFKQHVYRLVREHADAAADRLYRDQLVSSAASAAMNIAEGFYPRP